MKKRNINKVLKKRLQIKIILLKMKKILIKYRMKMTNYMILNYLLHFLKKKTKGPVNPRPNRLILHFKLNLLSIKKIQPL